MTQNPVYRVLVFKEDGVYYAQCLEVDICTFADNLQDLKERFLALFELERNISIARNGEPFGGIDPAPKEFHDKWKAAKRRVEDDDTYPGAQLEFAQAA